MRSTHDFKRTLLTAAVACLALAAFVGCDSRAGKPLPAAAGVDSTRVTYERTCAVCHGARGEGKQLGTMNIPSLREGVALTDPDEKFFKQISDGGNGMPPFKHTFDDRQIQDLIRFIREEFQGKR
jgi:mono/diheme cytochrome c family protein